MKREILLLRHAHAENAVPGRSDAERNLSLRGIAEARAAGHWLHEQAAMPARILCSPAARARQTLEHALGEVADAPRLLLVGHNPGFETFVALLATGQSGDFRGMPPGGIAWFELDGTAEPGSGRLKAFWSP